MNWFVLVATAVISGSGVSVQELLDQGVETSAATVEDNEIIQVAP
jgi:hypothetical protein